MTALFDILIVEDQSVMRETLREFLQSRLPDSRIAETSSGPLAVELVRRCRPRAVLVDCELSEGNGVTLTAEIKLLFPETRIIVIGLHPQGPHIERALAAGASAFLSKEKLYTGLVPLLCDALQETSLSHHPVLPG